LKYACKSGTFSPALFLLQEPLNRLQEVPLDIAADAAIPQFDPVLHQVFLADQVFWVNNRPLNPETLSKLVQDNRDPEAVVGGQDVVNKLHSGVEYMGLILTIAQQRPLIPTTSPILSRSSKSVDFLGGVDRNPDIVGGGQNVTNKLRRGVQHVLSILTVPQQRPLNLRTSQIRSGLTTIQTPSSEFRMCLTSCTEELIESIQSQHVCNKGHSNLRTSPNSFSSPNPFRMTTTRTPSGGRNVVHKLRGIKGVVMGLFKTRAKQAALAHIPLNFPEQPGCL
jgi:hypothetical protein